MEYNIARKIELAMRATWKRWEKTEELDLDSKHKQYGITLAKWRKSALYEKTRSDWFLKEFERRMKKERNWKEVQAALCADRLGQMLAAEVRRRELKEIDCEPSLVDDLPNLPRRIRTKLLGELSVMDFREYVKAYTNRARPDLLMLDDLRELERRIESAMPWKTVQEELRPKVISLVSERKPSAEKKDTVN